MESAALTPEPATSQPAAQTLRPQASMHPVSMDIQTVVTQEPSASLAVAAVTSSGETSSLFTPPFAVVDELSEGSPASTAGVQVIHQMDEL
jgi:hypothetical protein